MQRHDQNAPVGPFSLGRIIGSGGFGTVYEATDSDGQVVALKLLAPHVDSEETLERFQREGKIRIEHPNVVRVIDAGQDRGVSYIAFELLQGKPLNVLLEDAPLPPADVIGIARQICAGLAAAHERDIVHRDLKPGNVFCCADGSVKILDFGIARPMSSAGPQLTMAGSVIGTPGYLAPEQAKGEANISPAADIWSLGVILFQALTGKNPFMRQTAVATILAVVLEEAPTLGTFGLPPGLAEHVQRCLRKEPSERWGSAAEIGRALEQIDFSASPVAKSADDNEASIPTGERRVVALLLASEVDDLASLDAAVRDWGGELIPIVGGAIGVFGGRTYEGDEVIRAVHAALEARETASYVAVATGRATGSAGTVSGEAVLAVERAVEAKLPGVAVDAVATRQLVGLFELKPARDGVFEVPRAFSVRETGNFPTVREDLPLLGREGELATIDAAVAAALDDRRAIVMWVAGPPGIGKTRLRAELEKQVRARDDVRLMSARSESHRRDAAYHLMGALLRSAPMLEPFFLNPGVSEARRRRALVELCEEVLGDPRWARQCVEPLARLLDLPDVDGAAVSSVGRHSDPQLMADRLRVSLADLFGSMARKWPLVLSIDDAQWADTESLELLDELLDRLHGEPFLVLVASRPELEEKEEKLFEGRELIRVEPRGLRVGDVARVAAAIAKREVPAALCEEVAARTGGNPFFVEQIVRELVEHDLLDREFESLPIPLDVEGAVQSRLDHLPYPEKQLCKRAAVYVSSFTETALMALDTPDPARHLGALAKRGLVSAHTTRADPSEREYRFRSSLFAEVAYRMNSDEACRDLHRLAAEFLGSAARADAEKLAYHWEHAGEHGRAAEAYAEAAMDASGRGDSPSVLRCSGRAFALGLVGGRAAELYLVRADSLSFMGQPDAQREALDRALLLAQTTSQRARALSLKGTMIGSEGETEAGLRLTQSAVNEARTIDDVEILALALARHGWLQLYAGRVSEAALSIGEAAALPNLTPMTAALVASWRGQLYSAMGDLGKRREAYQDATDRYRAIGDLQRISTSQSNLADTNNRIGAYEEAETALREALTSCRRIGNRVVEGYALANLGYALTGLDRIDEALEVFDDALALANELVRPRLALAIRLYRLRAEFHRGDPLGVAAEARRVAQEAREAGTPSIEASARAVASRAALAGDDAETAKEDAERAMEVRDSVGTMEEDEAEIFVALAEALRALGEHERAREIVARGASRLEFLAGRIEDADWRARFLIEVPMNRRLIELDGE